MQAMLITGIVIGIPGAIVIGSSRFAGNSFQILNGLKVIQTGIFEVTRAYKNLAISREPPETIALEQIKKLMGYF